jgi:hypothetical protein
VASLSPPQDTFHCAHILPDEDTTKEVSLTSCENSSKLKSSAFTFTLSLPIQMPIQILITTQRETKNLVLIGITRLVMRFCYGKMVYSTNQIVHLKRNLGLLHRFIRMVQLGLDTEQAQNASILEE